MAFILKTKDIEWLNTQHPRLKINDNQLVGKIDFQSSYNNIELSDSYDIHVDLNTKLKDSIPKVYETSEKIVNIAKKLNIDSVDLHLNTDNSLCLVIKDRENEYFEDEFTIQEYFENCIEPYLYWVSFYEKFGKAPWEEYAHGNLGYFELFDEGHITYEKLMNKFNLYEIRNYLLSYQDNKCICSKNKKGNNCHPKIFSALKKISNIRYLNSFCLKTPTKIETLFLFKNVKYE